MYRQSDFMTVSMQQGVFPVENKAQYYCSKISAGISSNSCKSKSAVFRKIVSFHKKLLW